MFLYIADATSIGVMEYIVSKYVNNGTTDSKMGWYFAKHESTICGIFVQIIVIEN